MRAENGSTDNFAVFLLGDDLNKAFGLIDDQGLAAADKREAADFKLTVFCLGFRLGHTDAGNLGRGVHAARY